MTKDGTKCSSDEGKGIDGAASNQAAVLMSAIGENLADIADVYGLDLTVTKDLIRPHLSPFIYTVTERRTRKVMCISREADELRGYIIAYSQGKNAGITEMIIARATRPFAERDDWKKIEAAKEIVELGQKFLDLLQMGDGS